MPDLLHSLGWDAGPAALWCARDRGDLRPARVSRVDRAGFDLLDASGPTRATASGAVLGALAGRRGTVPCVGDWVGVRRWPDGRQTVETVLPRRTAVVRASASGRSEGQVLVANHDVAMVVEPLHPEPDLGRVERLLALAWQSGARPVVVLTKADLVPDADDVAADIAGAAPGVDVHPVSTVDDSGVDGLRPCFAPGRTVALLGPSGAGKSTLTNRLAGAEIMATRQLRADGKGRHTTTYRELVLLPGGGVVIDTPGLRKVGLYAASDGISRVFDDVERLERECRFVDCRHDTEPGCAVQLAIAAGELELRRLESWRKLQRELFRIEVRKDARLHATELARWKQQVRERSHGRGRPRG